MSHNYSDFSNYILKETIGEGNFGKVKLSIFTPTGEKFAIKILNKKRIKEKMKKSITNENEIIKNFNHINIIYVYQIIEQPENYYIIMEYCEKGELFDYIVKNKRLKEEETSIFFYQLINGLEYIHNQKICHRDLKPENLLLTKNKILKIIDFGLSHKLDNHLLLTKCGSPSYASPELITKKFYDGIKNDIWCCGIILYAMICGFLPFEGENNEELFKNILKCKPDFPHFISHICKELIIKILNPIPENRICINDIKKELFYIKGKELYNAKYLDFEKNILSNRIIHKNNNVKNKIKSLIILNKNNKDNIFNKKKILNANIKVKEIDKEKKRYEEKSIFNTDNIIKHKNKISYNNNINILQNRNKKKNNVLSPNHSLKNQFINKRFFREFSPGFSMKEIIGVKRKKNNIPCLNNSNLVLSNINYNINHLFLKDDIHKDKNIQTMINDTEKNLYLSKQNKKNNSTSPNNNININKNYKEYNGYDSVTKKTYYMIINSMSNKLKFKKNKKNNETLSRISNLSNYTNYSNNHNNLNSRNEKLIYNSSRRDTFNYLPILNNQF